MDAGHGIRIAKWRVGESTGQKAGEYTQGSWRAIPVVTEIDAIICYQVRGFVEKTVPEETINTETRTFWTKQQYEAATALPTA